MRVSFKYELGDMVFVAYEEEIMKVEIVQQIRSKSIQDTINIHYAVKTDKGRYFQRHESLISRSAEGLGMRLAKKCKK